METLAESIERREEEKKRRQRDWHEMLSSEAAFRCFRDIFLELGYGAPMGTEIDMWRRNFCDYLLNRIAQGNVHVYARLLVELQQREDAA